MKRICCPRVALGNNCLDESAFGRSAEGNRPSIKTSCAKASACSLRNSQEVGEQSGHLADLYQCDAPICKIPLRKSNTFARLWLDFGTVMNDF